MKALNWFLGAGQQIQMAIGIAMVTAIVLLFGALTASTWYLTGQIERRDATITKLNTDLALCQGNVDTLKGSIRDQNKAVEALGDATRAAIEAGKRAAAAANAQAEAHRQTAISILNAKPEDASDLCLSAQRLIEQKAGKR